MNFNQPSSTAIALNRVTGPNVSNIEGLLTANGNVFLVNRNGVIFHRGAVVDVGGLLATTSDITNQDFLSGRYRFTPAEGPVGTVENAGRIKVSEGGLVALVGPWVSNSGVIEARLGRVALGSGATYTLDLFGDDLVKFAVDDAFMEKLSDGALVAQSGRIEADGGRVWLMAGSAKEVLDGVINLSGVVRARSVSSREGRIVLEGDEVHVAGTLNATSETGRGGEIDVLGESIELASAARVDASGTEGGGEIHIGGDYQGRGQRRRAATTAVDDGAVVRADATVNGDGGTVIVWSDGHTRVDGQLSAQGGPGGGDGGLVETSSAGTLEFSRSVKVGAPAGKAGTWLLDPKDIDIDRGRADSIEETLNDGGNVSISTSDGGDGEGNIEVNASITKTEGDDASLSLRAHNRIDVNKPIRSEEGELDVSLKAGRTVNVKADIDNNGGSFSSSVTGVSSETKSDPDIESEPESGDDPEISEAGSEEESDDDPVSVDLDATVAGEEAFGSEPIQAEEDEKEQLAAIEAPVVPEVVITGTEVLPEPEVEITSIEASPEPDVPEGSGESVTVSVESETEPSEGPSEDLNSTTMEGTSVADGEEMADASEEDVEITGVSMSEPTTEITVPSDTPSITVSGDVVTRGGDISVDAGTEGVVIVVGTLDASTLEEEEEGGDVEVLGRDVLIAGDAAVDTSGDGGGGDIHIGGDYQGSGERYNSETTTIGKRVTIRSDATGEGDAGQVVLWSDGTTRFQGSISARGGPEGGDGGSVEVSGKKNLDFRGEVDAGASQGNPGTLLLDPETLNVVDANTGAGDQDANFVCAADQHACVWPPGNLPDFGAGTWTPEFFAELGIDPFPQGEANTISWGRLIQLAEDTSGFGLELWATDDITFEAFNGTVSTPGSPTGDNQGLTITLPARSLRVTSTGGSIVFEDTSNNLAMTGGSLTFFGADELILGNLYTGGRPDPRLPFDDSQIRVHLFSTNGDIGVGTINTRAQPDRFSDPVTGAPLPQVINGPIPLDLASIDPQTFFSDIFLGSEVKITSDRGSIDITGPVYTAGAQFFATANALGTGSGNFAATTIDTGANRLIVNGSLNTLNTGSVFINADTIAFDQINAGRVDLTAEDDPLADDEITGTVVFDTFSTSDLTGLDSRPPSPLPSFPGLASALSVTVGSTNVVLDVDDVGSASDGGTNPFSGILGAGFTFDGGTVGSSEVPVAPDPAPFVTLSPPGTATLVNVPVFPPAPPPPVAPPTPPLPLVIPVIPQVVPPLPPLPLGPGPELVLVVPKQEVTLRSLTDVETEISSETEEPVPDPLYEYASRGTGADQESEPEDDGSGTGRPAFNPSVCDPSGTDGAASDLPAGTASGPSDASVAGQDGDDNPVAKLKSRPIPLVELGAHLDRTTAMDYDPAGNRLVTASDDGTLRAWDARNGRLLQTMRAPKGARKEGALYALAVEPAGKMVAAGGWTGYQWDKAMSVYLFDLDSGELVRRVPGLPGVVTALDYAPDGTRLAVATDTGEVRLYSVPDYALIANDERCPAGPDALHFNAAGTLAVGCGDGWVRLYGDGLDLIAARRLHAEGRPAQVRFSPDGRHLAVASEQTGRVSVVDPASLAPLFELEVDAAAPMTDVAWAADSLTLYAAGGVANHSLVKWARAGRGARMPVDTEHHVRNLLALRDGALAYTTRAYAVGVMEADGTERFHRTPGRVDHRGKARYFRVSDDAGVVTFALDDTASRYAEFAVSDRRYREVTQPYPGLRAPIAEHAMIQLAGWDGSSTPTLNGTPLDAGSNRVIYSAAISPDSGFFVLGGDFELRTYEADGRLRWSREIGSDAYAVNVSGDTHVVVAAHQDGSIHWYRAEDGREILGLLVHAGVAEWVAWIPSGRYMSSPNGDRYVGWQLNNGPDATPDFYTAWQFERMLYRPDVVQENFGCRGYVAGAGAGGTESFTIDRLRDSAPPGVSLAVTGVGEAGTATIEIVATKHKRPIEDYAVYVNSIPVTPFKDRVLSGTEHDTFRRSHTVPLFPGENEIRVEVLTDQSLEVAQAFLDVDPEAVAVDRKGNLYVLAVGVNVLENIPHGNLAYAAQDADALAAGLERHAGGLFERVHTRVLSDFSGELPTRKNIENALPFLRQAGPDDTVILFLAAHGLSNQAGDYHLVPRDARTYDVAEILRETRSGTVRRFNSLIRWDTFFSALRAASGRRLLIVDTCQARKIEGTYDALSLAKRSAASSFALLAASKGNEQSQEYPPGGHGLFTYALLDGLQGAADEDQNGVVELSEMLDHTLAFVKENRIEKRLTQTPQLVAPSALTLAPLGVPSATSRLSVGESR